MGNTPYSGKKKAESFRAQKLNDDLSLLLEIARAKRLRLKLKYKYHATHK
jgi:hypothetical protein